MCITWCHGAQPVTTRSTQAEQPLNVQSSQQHLLPFEGGVVIQFDRLYTYILFYIYILTTGIQSAKAKEGGLVISLQLLCAEID